MLTRMLAAAVERDPAKAAVVKGSRRVSYAALAELVGRAAAGLRRLGVGEGDAVGVLLPNGPEFVACLFACAWVRAVMLPLHPTQPAEGVRHAVADANARVLIADPSAAAAPRVVSFDSLPGDDIEPPPADESDGPVLFLFTTGSTATRKRLRCTQRNLYFEAVNFVETVGLTAADNILCTIPLSHSYGIGNCLLDAVCAGSTLVMPESDAVPFPAVMPRLFELVREEEVRFYPGVPYQFEMLAAVPESPHAELSGLRLCVSSGDVLPRRTFDRFLARYGQPIRSLYGSTEAGSVAMNTDPDPRVRYGSLGPPLKNVGVTIRDADGRDLPTDTDGQIWVNSPVLPPTGYDGHPAATAAAFRDGWYCTGDLGRLDARGHLHMSGRKQTFVEVSGYKVDLSEVEGVLLDHPSVREAAAVGVPLPELGTLVKAVVVADGPCGEAELLAHCRRRLAPAKLPRLVEFRDSLPRSPVGKVLKAELESADAFPRGVDSSAFAGRWESTPPTERSEFVAAEIRAQAARALGKEPAAISRTSLFRDMGFDSLTSAELHLRLSKLTGLQLPLSTLWHHPTVDELAAVLAARLTPADGPDVPAVMEITPPNDLHTGVVAMSDAEAWAALRRGGPP